MAGGARKFKFTKHFIKINLQIQEIIYEGCQLSQATKIGCRQRSSSLASPNATTELAAESIKSTSDMIEILVDTLLSTLSRRDQVNEGGLCSLQLVVIDYKRITR